MVNDVFTRTPEQVATATTVVRAFDEATAEGRG